MTLHAKFVELTLNRVIYWYDGVKKNAACRFFSIHAAKSLVVV